MSRMCVSESSAVEHSKAALVAPMASRGWLRRYIAESAKSALDSD
jgi:hypothetical protein